jgi:cell division protein FtsL
LFVALVKLRQPVQVRFLPKRFTRAKRKNKLLIIAHTLEALSINRQMIFKQFTQGLVLIELHRLEEKNSSKNTRLEGKKSKQKERISERRTIICSSRWSDFAPHWSGVYINKEPSLHGYVCDEVISYISTRSLCIQVPDKVAFPGKCDQHNEAGGTGKIAAKASALL